MHCCSNYCFMLRASDMVGKSESTERWTLIFNLFRGLVFHLHYLMFSDLSHYAIYIIYTHSIIKAQRAQSSWVGGVRGPSDFVLCVWGFLIGPLGAVLTLTHLLPVHLFLHKEAECVWVALIIVKQIRQPAYICGLGLLCLSQKKVWNYMKEMISYDHHSLYLVLSE